MTDETLLSTLDVDDLNSIIAECYVDTTPFGDGLWAERESENETIRICDYAECYPVSDHGETVADLRAWVADYRRNAEA
jgi:hypothetical protein